MAADAPLGGGVPVAGLTIVALLVSATIFAPAPFQLLRPPEPERFRYDLAKDQDVDARLWEDPFAVVRRYDEILVKDQAGKDGTAPLTPSSDPEQCEKAIAPGGADPLADPHGLCYFRERLDAQFAEPGTPPGKRPQARTTLLGVMVHGYSFVGANEWRRRVRYAVIAGLNAAGYLPANSEQIGYFRTKVRLQAPGGPPEKPQTLYVPFERFSPPDGGADHVLVLWLDETVLSGRWVAKLASFFASISTACPGVDGVPQRADRYPLRIIGPSDSDTLATAGEELQRPPAESDPRLRCGYGLLSQARILSPFATAPDRKLKSPDPKVEFAAQFHQGIESRAKGGPTTPKPQQPTAAGPLLLRTIATDDHLLKALSAELVHRGLDGCNDAVAVIGEWDSLYARSLADELKAELQEVAPGDAACEFEFVRYSYLRGLDGVTVGRASRKDDAAERSTPSGKETQARSIEWPEGRDQRDYLRRLPMRMRDDAARAKRRIAAIGVFGSDVHDKLLVLQALRPTLPDAVFFTTDLDARLFHPRTFDWTRNLLVASSFDLALTPDLQKDVPPFRDMYQTAAFLATQLALYDPGVAPPMGAFASWAARNGPACARDLSKKALENWLGAPHLYELGRGTRVPLADTRDGDCVVHAPEQSLAPSASLGITSWVVMVLAGVALLIVPSTPSLRRLRPWAGSEGRRWPCTYLLAFFELVAFFFTCLVLWRLFRGLPGSAAVAGFGGSALALIAMSFLFPGTSWARRTVERMLRRPVARGNPRRDAGATAIQLAIAVIAAVALVYVLSPGSGPLEPFDFWVGVSAWPTELLRLVALVLTVVFLDYAWFGGMDDGDRLTRLYFRGEPRDLFRRSRDYWRRLHPLRPDSVRALVQVANWFLELGIWSFNYRWFLKGRPGETLRTVRGSLIWAEYLRRGQGWRRFVRVSFWATVTLALGILAFFVFGDGHGPLLPARGEANRMLFNVTLGAAMVAFVVLIVTIADATMLTIKFVRALQAGRTRYPAATIEHFVTELGDRSREYWTRPIAAHVTRRDTVRGRFNSLLDDWIDVRLIADRTEWIGNLIYAPFLILALLIVSRSPFFDNWTLPPALAVIFAAYLVWAMVLAILLQVFSSRARNVAVQRMREDLLWLQGLEGVPAEIPGQFSTLIEQVRTIRKGAFVPFLEQPLVRAALAPLGTVGGIQFVQYLLMLQS